MRLEQRRSATMTSRVVELEQQVDLLQGQLKVNAAQAEQRLDALKVFGGMDLAKMTIREKDFVIHSQWESLEELKHQLRSASKGADHARRELDSEKAVVSQLQSRLQTQDILLRKQREQVKSAEAQVSAAAIDELADAVAIVCPYMTRAPEKAVDSASRSRWVLSVVQSLHKSCDAYAEELCRVNQEYAAHRSYVEQVLAGLDAMEAAPTAAKTPVRSFDKETADIPIRPAKSPSAVQDVEWSPGTSLFSPGGIPKPSRQTSKKLFVNDSDGSNDEAAVEIDVVTSRLRSLPSAVLTGGKSKQSRSSLAKQ